MSSRSGAKAAGGVGTRELREGLTRVLSEHFGRTSQMLELTRRPSPYTSSFPIEELDVVLEGGVSLRLIFKDLSSGALSEGARRAKPSFLYDPLREIQTYRGILDPAKFGTAICYGADVDQQRGRYWLFLENVNGVALWQVGDLALWEHVARWLAGMHGRFAKEASWQLKNQHLLRYDADFYLLWLRRAHLFAGQGKKRSELSQSDLEWLATRYERAVELMLGLPVTFIHGEFYASNVILADVSGAQRVCPIDWEIAGVGPGLIDLAALTGGAWEEADRTAVALAYRETSNGLGDSSLAPEEFVRALDCCRLHLSIRWLGWAPSWSPPRKHRHDWAGEAMRLAEQLDL